MPATYTHHFDTSVYKGDITINTGLYINGKFVDPIEKEGSGIEVVNPATGKVITSVLGGSAKDVDVAVAAATKAYKTSWGLKTPGAVRGQLIGKLADLIEKHSKELAALESLNTGKMYHIAAAVDVPGLIATLRYYAGWADKVSGQTIETTEQKFAYTRHEPYGAVGQIIPWNFPVYMLSWKIGPALATGNTIVLKPSEITPLSALYLAPLFEEAGFPPGVFNLVNGYGNTVGQAISEHMQIEKVAFTGSTLTGRKILKAAADSNLKVVSLELGGKSPNIIFDDADLEQALKWAQHGIFFNMGQSCVAGSRIFVQEGIYDRFIAAFKTIAENVDKTTGDPFSGVAQNGPQASQVQFDRIMNYIESGKEAGATVLTGGTARNPDSGGFFVTPTVFTDVKPEMKIVKEEIFGPVAVVIKFKTEEEVIEQANNTTYGLACAVFTENISRGIRVAHALEAGTAWINTNQTTEVNVPFGGYKTSGIGRELGQYALDTYTQVKGVHVNLGHRL